MPTTSDGKAINRAETPIKSTDLDSPWAEYRQLAGQRGIIGLTLAAEFALHLAPIDRAANTVEQLTELQQVRDPQRAAPAR